MKGWGLGTLGAEWQCSRDCQTGVSVPNRYDRCRVAVKGWGLGTLGAEWQRISHCHSPVNVLHVTFRAEWQCDRYVRCRVAVKEWGLGTLGAEWQCGRDCQTGVSVPNRYARGRVAVRSVRSGPSGSVMFTATRW